MLLDVRDREAFAGVARRRWPTGTAGSTCSTTTPGSRVAGGIEELTPEHWDSAIDVNLRGVIHGVEAVYPVMRAQGHGHIVITASLAGLIPVPLLGPYTVTKHAVVALARVLRLEAAASGVQGDRRVPGVRGHPPARQHQPGHPADRGQPRSGSALVRRAQGKPISPEQVAAIVLAALPRNPEIIVAPRVLGRLGALAERLAPGVVRRVSAHEIGRYRRLGQGRR